MTIFDSIVYDENTLTELFKNMLRYRTFRRAIIELIDIEIPIESFDFEDISTQVYTKDQNGIPDIQIENESVKILIEVKITNTQLTGNQPEGYLAELSNAIAEHKGLLLIIPKNYKYLSEYEYRLNNYPIKMPYDIITWSDILNEIEKLELYEGNPIIQEFRELLKDWFETEPVKITQKFVKNMITKYTPVGLEQMTNIIDQMHDQFKFRKINLRKRPPKNIMEEYGFYIEVNDKVDFFIGEWFPFWKETGQPICLAIKTSDKEIENSYINACKKNLFPTPIEIDIDKSWLSTYLPFTSDERNFDIDDVVNKIILLIDALNIN